MDRLNVHIHSTPFRHASRMIREGQSLISQKIFDKVVFLATYETGLEREERIGDRQYVVRLGTASRSTGKIAHLLRWMYAAYVYAVDVQPICINVHSLTLLPLGVALKVRTGARLVYDTHELESRTSAASALRKRIYGIAERALIRFVDHTFVVCGSIEDWYRRSYGDIPITTIKNYPSLSQVKNANIDLRKKINAKRNDMIFIYQGRIGEGRGIEDMLDAFERDEALPGGGRRHLVLMGDGPLVGKVKAISEHKSWVHWIPPVDPSEVLSVTRQADVGLLMAPNVSESYFYSLPNKLLESLAAEVPMVAPDWPEMRTELDNGRLGWLIEPSSADSRRLIFAITSSEIKTRKESLRGWHCRYNWEVQESALVAPYKQFLDAQISSS